MAQVSFGIRVVVASDCQRQRTLTNILRQNASHLHERASKSFTGHSSHDQALFQLASLPSISHPYPDIVSVLTSSRAMGSSHSRHNRRHRSPERRSTGPPPKPVVVGQYTSEDGWVRAIWTLEGYRGEYRSCPGLRRFDCHCPSCAQCKVPPLRF